jgi:para-nitrobenzyl esterase
MIGKASSILSGGALVLAALTGASASPAAPVAHTAYGDLRGSEQGDVSVYKGIPFAAPPTGDLRWRAPTPPVRWSGLRPAEAFAPACPQAPPDPGLGLPALPTSEDCLCLNVWTPARSPGRGLPVMVWIYGGAFNVGGTALPAYSGAHLAERGVVVVSIAYRVGAFGFLAHPELTKESGHDGSGNYGLLDQIAGLEWVRDNIAAFGGDPHRVTIFGESAGGISVSMLAASPLAKGLFQGAISQSGGSFGPPQHVDEGGTNVPTLKVAEERGRRYLAKLGVATIAEARRLSPQRLLDAAGPAFGGGIFWPNFDGHVLPGDQYALYSEKKYSDVPVLIGTNADEGAPFPQAPHAADYVAMVHKRYGDYADRILAQYPGTSDAQAVRSGRDLFRETGFAWPTWTWARLQTRTGGKPVFLYFFDRRPPYPDEPRFADWGAAHGAEIPYVFGTLDPGPIKWTAADHALSEAMMTYWSNFAKTGNPNGEGLPAWPVFSEAHPAAMHFDAAGPALGGISNLDKLVAVDGYFAWLRQAGGARGAE